MDNLKFAGIIPARYASTRFPGKPLEFIGSKMIIQHVYERASSVLENLVVATDDNRIYDAVTGFGGKACMTSTEHKSGTDRCREAALKTFPDADVIINIQGDEPFIDVSQITSLMTAFDNPQTDIATLIRPFDKSLGYETLADPNLVKVVKANDGSALYFSRSVIPYVRNCDNNKWPEAVDYFTHIGIYAYRMDVLRQLTDLKQSPLEKAESLEQLRWLQAGYKIVTSITNHCNIGIDTPKDLENARAYFNTLSQ